MPTNENAMVKLNGHGFQFLIDVLNNYALNRASEMFPGLRELVAQDPRPEGMSFDDHDLMLNLEFTENAIADIRTALLEAIGKTRAMQDADEEDARPALFFNIPKELNKQLDELLHFAYWFRAELPDDLSKRANKIADERIFSEKPDRFHLSVSDWMVPLKNRQAFCAIVSDHLTHQVSDARWQELRQWALHSPSIPACNWADEDVDPDLTRKSLVETCLQEASGIGIDDYMVGPFKDSAQVIGTIEDRPVYFITYGGFYVFEDKSGFILQLDITYPVNPPGW